MVALCAAVALLALPRASYAGGATVTSHMHNDALPDLDGAADAAHDKHHDASHSHDVPGCPTVSAGIPSRLADLPSRTLPAPLASRALTPGERPPKPVLQS